MKFTKNLLLLITIMFVGIFYSKETYSKEKKSKTDYNYVTEKIKTYSDENKTKLQQTLAQLTEIKVKLTQIEENWLLWQEELEQILTEIDAEFTQI